jgi:hypothetical protein
VPGDFLGCGGGIGVDLDEVTRGLKPDDLPLDLVELNIDGQACLLSRIRYDGLVGPSRHGEQVGVRGHEFMGSVGL